MNKQISEDKKKHLLSILTFLTAVFLSYALLCDYAGISGRIAFFQQEFFYISRYLGFIRYPFWFIHATLSGMLANLCIYAIYRIKFQKKNYIMLLIGLFVPYIVNAHFEPGAKALQFMTIIMLIFIGGMFAMANLPGMIGRAVIRQIAFQNPDLKEDAARLSQHQLRKIEWIRFFPLKKVLIAGMWLFSFIMGILGIVAFRNDPQMDFLKTALILLAIVGFTAQKAWKYIITPYHCVPVLNKMLSKKQIQTLLQDEQFELFSFHNEDLQKYVPVLISKNWAIVEGMLVSRKLILRGDINFYGPKRPSSRIEITYLNGECFKTRITDIYLGGEHASQMKDTLDHIAGIHFPWCEPKKVMQKYETIFPEIKNPKEKLYYLLTHDVSGIKEEYETMFASKSRLQKGRKVRNRN